MCIFLALSNISRILICGSLLLYSFFPFPLSSFSSSSLPLSLTLFLSFLCLSLPRIDKNRDIYTCSMYLTTSCLTSARLSIQLNCLFILLHKHSHNFQFHFAVSHRAAIFRIACLPDSVTICFCQVCSACCSATTRRQHLLASRCVSHQLPSASSSPLPTSILASRSLP